MMFKKQIFILFCCFCASCNEVAELSNTPQISLISLNFEANTLETSRDSLKVEINFLDGNGDLGLETADIFPPYQALDTLKNNLGNYMFFDATQGVYDRESWLIVTRLPQARQQPHKRYEPNSGVHFDTVKVTRNYYRHYNFFLDPYYQDDDGVFVKVKDKIINGQQAVFTDQFYSRFPKLNTQGTARPLKGILKAKFGGIYSENPVLSQKILKFEVYIKDKQLNESNHVFSDPIQLSIQ